MSDSAEQRSAPPRTPSALDKQRDSWRNDLIKLLLGFVLTGVVGTGITQMYKNREIRGELQRKGVDAATAAFLEVTDSFAKRHYYALLANAAVEQWNEKRAPDGKKAIEEAFRLFNDSITEWNLRRFRTEAVVETHFGKSYRTELTTKVAPILGRTRDDLIDLRNEALDEDTFDQPLHDAIFARIENEEEPAILAFCDRLSQSIKSREKSKSVAWAWLTGD